jgi:hypothetical protein
VEWKRPAASLGPRRGHSACNWPYPSAITTGSARSNVVSATIYRDDSFGGAVRALNHTSVYRSFCCRCGETWTLVDLLRA